MMLKSVDYIVKIVSRHLHGIDRQSYELDIEQDARISKRVVAREYIPPLIIAPLVLIIEFDLSGESATIILLISGVLTAFFFQVVVQMLERSAVLLWESASESRTVSKSYILLIFDVAASSTYAILVSISVSISTLCVIEFEGGLSIEIASAISLCLFAHLIFVLVNMVFRLFDIIQGNIRRKLKHMP